MKANVKLIGKWAIIILLAVECFCGIFYFGDVVFDRMTGDWFEEHFFYNIFYFETNGGRQIGVPKFRWPTFKSYLFWAVIILIILWGITVVVTILICRHQTKRETARTAGKLAKQYFAGEVSIEKRFPKEYAELLDYLSELRDQMNHNEQVLKDESAKKNDLIAYLAHDLKTPLTSVIGYLSLMEEAPDMPLEQKAKYVHIALDKALRLEQLINEFFEITRYNLHEIVLEKECIDLSYMLAQMADEFYPILMERGNTVQICAEEALTVVADADKLARVFNNILKNAIAYSDACSPISIRAEQLGGCVRVSIVNHGRTIPRQKLQSIFAKFYRLDDARSSNTGGAGLGLAIAKEIVTLHGGSIHAVSEDQLTTFTVVLPYGKS